MTSQSPWVYRKKNYILYYYFRYSLLEDNLVSCCCVGEPQLQLSHPQKWDPLKQEHK